MARILGEVIMKIIIGARGTAQPGWESLERG